MKYAGKQPVIGTAVEQYIDFLPQLDSLINIYGRSHDWEKEEMMWGMFMANMRFTQQHKDSQKCYNCKLPGHVCANCLKLKKKKKGNLDQKHFNEKRW